jgi:hypothetical protein
MSAGIALPSPSGERVDSPKADGERETDTLCLSLALRACPSLQREREERC